MSEFNLKKYISNNPLITEGKEEKVDEVVNEELDLVHVYDKNGEKIIGTGQVVKSEKPNPSDVIVQFDRELILSFPRDRVKPVKEEVNEEEELTFIPSSGTKAGGTFELNNRKYELTSPIKNVTIGGRYVTTLPKGTILYNLAGGLLADHESLRKFETRSNQYFDKSNYSGIRIRKDKEVLNNIIDNSKVLEFYG
jgi:hypothetical protein